MLNTGKKIAAGFVALSVLANCTGAEGRALYDPIEARPELKGPMAVDVETPMSGPMSCVRDKLSGRQKSRTLTVGKIDDYTGFSQDTTRPVLTRGATLMVISALDKLGVPLVERYDTSVADLELRYANQKLIGADNEEQPYKEILAGVLDPSDYMIMGGITELDFNIYSTAFDLQVGRGSRSDRLYAISVAVDLRMVNTETLRVVDTVSFKKQVFGRENQNGLTLELLDTGLGVSSRERAQEPIQTSIRLVLERAVIELISGLYRVDTGSCLTVNGTTPAATDAVPENPPKSKT